MAKPKKAEQATTVVYCGPSIPGVAKQYTAYTNGIPTALAEAIVQQPAMEGLVVPLEQLPEAMNLRSGTGHISRLYRLVQVNTKQEVERHGASKPGVVSGRDQPDRTVGRRGLQVR